MSDIVTIRFRVGITDRSSGAPFGVARVYDNWPVRDCGHTHTSRTAAEKCARRMAQGISSGGGDVGVVLFTRSDCSCRGIRQTWTESVITPAWSMKIAYSTYSLLPCLECDALSLGGEE